MESKTTGTTDLEQEYRRLRAALIKIKKMKAETIAPGFKHGPQLLFDHCQRIAREALCPTKP